VQLICVPPPPLLLLLQVVKAYVSVYSDEQGKERAISNLKRIAP
jgi:hypothetical protein